MSGGAGTHRFGADLWQWVWVSVVLIAVAIVGASLVVARTGDDADRDAWAFAWPASYSGPVWITVEAAHAERHTIAITWGPWRRRLVHEGSGSASYRFNKDPGPTVPITVEVEADATVSFGSGTPPADAEDIGEEWTRPSDASIRDWLERRL